MARRSRLNKCNLILVHFLKVFKLLLLNREFEEILKFSSLIPIRDRIEKKMGFSGFLFYFILSKEFV